MVKLNRTDVIKSIASSCDIEISIVRTVIEAFEALVVMTLFQRGKIVFKGFGTFYSDEKDARLINDIGSGQKIPFGKRFLPKFKFGDVMKKRIRDLEN